MLAYLPLAAYAHGQRGMKRGAAEKMRVRAAPGLKKFARADHHDILEKRRLGNADADSTRASESRRSDAVEFYWSQTSSTAPILVWKSKSGYTLDTGAMASVLPLREIERMDPQPNVVPTETVLKGFNKGTFSEEIRRLRHGHRPRRQRRRGASGNIPPSRWKRCSRGKLHLHVRR